MNHESGYERAHRQAEHIFRNLLPAHGMAVREGQIVLCHAMLDALFNKEVLLCEAGVGIGKTLAYLVACVLWQQQRPAALVEPVVISTSSVTLQEAILREYLPFLSQVLLQEHIIQAPICARSVLPATCACSCEKHRLNSAAKGTMPKCALYIM